MSRPTLTTEWCSYPVLVLCVRGVRNPDITWELGEDDEQRLCDSPVQLEVQVEGVVPGSTALVAQRGRARHQGVRQQLVQSPHVQQQRLQLLQ